MRCFSKGGVLLSANFAFFFTIDKIEMSYYCGVIYVGLCKVSQPSRKSYGKKFVVTKNACINDGATLKEKIKKITHYI